MDKLPFKYIPGKNIPYMVKISPISSGQLYLLLSVINRSPWGPLPGPVVAVSLPRPETTMSAKK